MNLRTASQLLRHLGVGWVAYRGWYALSQRTGVLRWRAPVSKSWDAQTLAKSLINPAHGDPARFRQLLQEQGGRFLFSPSDRPHVAPRLAEFDIADADWPPRRLREINEGFLRPFSGDATPGTWPPTWDRMAATSERSSTGPAPHFTRVNEFGHGDVKLTWEPNRFAFVYDLVRIYWRTGDEQCAERFWEAVEDWRRDNPPNRGVNWKCGQEATFRAMAWCFGLWGFLDSRHSSDQRIAHLATLLAGTGRRIQANIHYALSQRNNHGISEASGLFTIGLLFPFFRGSRHWVNIGWRLLTRQARELIYDDGGFSQYSANYHRVMLHDYLWVIRLAELNGWPVDAALRKRISRAGEFLLQVQDDRTGRVPRYGHDDGALVLPLTNCDYGDFRPVLQSVAALGNEGRYASGPWDEERLWLFGESSECPLRPPAFHDALADEGGYASLRIKDNLAFVRVGEFCDRPSHADLLHADLWWRGHNVTIDPGTYSYNATGIWANVPLASTACHNTVGVDGLDQMPRVGRFLFLPWPSSRVHRMTRTSGAERLALLDVSHDGYHRLDPPVEHRRVVVQLGDEHWVVVDRLRCKTERAYRLHWLFDDVPFEWDQNSARLRLTFPGAPDARYQVQAFCCEQAMQPSLVRAETGTSRGWQSPRYNTLLPALSLAVEATGTTVCFVTVLGPGAWGAKFADGVLNVEHPDWSARVDVATTDGPDDSPVVQAVRRTTTTTASGNAGERPAEERAT